MRKHLKILYTMYLCFFTAMLLSTVGCGNFFSQKPTEIQTENIFRDLSQVNIIPDANRPLPKIYTDDPKIISVKDGFKLFYFTKHHRPENLAKLIKEQLGNKISSSPATNQLIVQCTTREDANAVLGFLKEVDVPPIQVKIDCIISEIFADLTMDYETSAEILDLFGENVAVSSLLPGASIRSIGRKDIGLKAGISRTDFDALIDVLESRGYAKILMHPSVEVVNGTTAKIETKERVPIQEKILSGSNVIETIIYQDVIDYLEVTPNVYADGTIGLKTSAGIASKSTPEGVTQVPIITSREINNQENRILKGQSLVIGGIRKTERISVIRGVPFLKDIPGVGIIFSSKDFEDRAKEILFILTPSISSGGQDHPATVKYIREKHAKPEYKPGIQDVLMDPFGSDAKQRSPEKAPSGTKFERSKSNLKKTQAVNDSERIRLELLEKFQSLQLEAAKAEAQIAKAEARQAKAEAEKAKAEVEKLKQQSLTPTDPNS